MKNTLILAVFLFSCMSKTQQIQSNQLGLSQVNNQWMITVWSSSASQMRVHFYHNNEDEKPEGSLDMQSTVDGYWSVLFDDTWTGFYYTVQSFVDGKWMNEVVDPYARLVGVNGLKGFIDDLSQTDPVGWAEDKYVMTSQREAVIYELQIRDFSKEDKANFKFPGKYKAFTETGKKLNENKIGIDYLKELGITHVHLLPMFDFRSIDESLEGSTQYNWGYDPLNYNVPEGSFATDPYDPIVRVKEFKEMVMALHQAGIGVIMDVVYNHTGHSFESNFNQIDPGYYYRMVEGKFSNASACGNETASEQPMMRKFIIESMTYWMQEYHVDGFRVDLMGIHDIETMNQAKQQLLTINPNTLLYGEGWAAGSSPLEESRRALKQNASLLNDIPVFSDEYRDGLKGHWNTPEDRGFITGKAGTKESLKFGLVGGVNHPAIDFQAVNYTDVAWAQNTQQMISYISCHDGMTLQDKIQFSFPGLSTDQYLQKHKLALTMVMMSQAIPFLHAGSEFRRSKQFVDNSFESPDSINVIRWSELDQNTELINYTKYLISLKRSHPAFNISDQMKIAEHISFPTISDELLLACDINAAAVADSWNRIYMVFNGDISDKEVQLPAGEWYFAINSGELTEEESSIQGKIIAKGSTASILFQIKQ